jgi:hypothetical protein
LLLLLHRQQLSLADVPMCSRLLLSLLPHLMLTGQKSCHLLCCCPVPQRFYKGSCLSLPKKRAQTARLLLSGTLISADH